MSFMKNISTILIQRCLCGIVFIMVIFFAGLFSMREMVFAQVSPKISFGGKIVSQNVCNTGMLIYVKSAVAVKPFMWFWGNLRYSSHIPPHVGQSVLGLAGPTPAPCVLGSIPIGAGLPILFHGSSYK